jgi:hypothetical protein
MPPSRLRDCVRFATAAPRTRRRLPGAARPRSALLASRRAMATMRLQAGSLKETVREKRQKRHRVRDSVTLGMSLLGKHRHFLTLEYPRGSAASRSTERPTLHDTPRGRFYPMAHQQRESQQTLPAMHQWDALYAGFLPCRHRTQAKTHRGVATGIPSNRPEHSDSLFCDPSDNDSSRDSLRGLPKLVRSGSQLPSKQPLDSATRPMPEAPSASV